MEYSKVFLEPANSIHRQYEALRAYFVEGLSSLKAASRFGYTPGSFRVLCHEFRKNPKREFFLSSVKGPRKSPKKDRVREEVVRLRKQNLSIYDIRQMLEEMKQPLSPPAISAILKEEGFAKLPRRRDDERPGLMKPEAAAVSDARQLDLAPRRFRTRFGGLFLFIPFLARIPLGEMLQKASFPGSKMIPATQAVLSLLALKLFGDARHSHVMSNVFDPGLALFAGLNAIPKRAFLTEYSCRIDPASYPHLLHSWFDAVRALGLEHGKSFDLDFHAIPFHGEDALVEKHYISKRSRSQKGILAFVANDAENRVFCYVNANIRKDDRNGEILKFVEFWKQKTGKAPEELIFDSKLTTYPHLDELNKMGIKFITLRRRSAKMLAEIHARPSSDWKQIHLHNVGRVYRTPNIIDNAIPLRDYSGTVRQIFIRNLGHEEPTILLTNQLTRPAPTLIERYARRMIIENTIQDTVDFFHMDALSSAVAMKVNCDLVLTLMASSLYRILACKIANGYKTAKSRHIFRDFVAATATVSITETDIVVRFQKRAHNPLLIASGFPNLVAHIPWLGRKRLHLVLG